MNRSEAKGALCSICGRQFAKRDLVSGQVIRESIRNAIRQDHAEWRPEGFVCREDLNVFRFKHVQDLLHSEKGELTALEEDVLQSLHEHEVLAENVDKEFEQDRSLGQRLADHIAALGGSWAFLIGFGAFLALWIVMNSLVFLFRPVDPYPFILLNLLLSCLAAVQAPIIMMSQNRQEAKDRLRSQHDYKINLKAELEIRNLHEKVDHLLNHQWERLVEIQEVQLELLSELGRKRP